MVRLWPFNLPGPLHLAQFWWQRRAFSLLQCPRVDIRQAHRGVFYFRNRDASEHHEVLLPVGAAARFAKTGVLCHAAEAAERRKDAQAAREIVLALPANAEVSTEDRVATTRSFAQQHFVSKGLAVQLDVHAPTPSPGPP